MNTSKLQNVKRSNLTGCDSAEFISKKKYKLSGGNLFTDQKVINDLYQIMKDVHQILENYNIEYWVDGGTSLGAVRHGGIIPWDDDCDITVLAHKRTLNILNSVQFKEYIKQYNYGIIQNNYDYKIYKLDGEPMRLNPWKEHWKLFQIEHPEIKGGRSAIWTAASKTYDKSIKRDSKFAYPFLDIFTAKVQKSKNGGDEIVYLNNWWNKCTYKYSEVFPRRIYNFGDYKVYGPGKAANYFTKCYGSDWNVVGYKHIDHANPHTHAVTKKAVKFTLTDKDRQPAKWTVNIVDNIPKENPEKALKKTSDANRKRNEANKARSVKKSNNKNVTKKTNAKSKQLLEKKTKKVRAKRCPNGTRRNKKTGECEPK